MQAEYKPVTLENLNGGQIVALFERELKRVLENIADENTKSKDSRSITISIKFRPEEDRGNVDIEVSADAKLAKVKPSKSFAVLSNDGSKITAYQTNPKQLNLAEEALGDNMTPFPGAAGGRN